MISIILATRKRPELFKAMCLSALDTALEPNEIEFISYHDDDDDSVYEYVGNHKEVVGVAGARTFNQMFNECCKVASGDIYMNIADDCTFRTKGWDKRVRETFDQYPDKIVFVAPDNEEWARWGFGVIGFLHKNWVDTLGYFINPHKWAESSDRWTNEVAVAINRRVHLLDVTVSHENVRDQVHKDKNKRGRESRQTKNYWLPEMDELRKNEAKLLQNFIDNFVP